MQRERRYYRCNNCGYTFYESFYAFTGEALHDQWIDLKEYARRESAILSSHCEQCGQQGFKLERTQLQ